MQWPTAARGLYLSVGGVLVHAMEESALIIENVAVHPMHQRRGLGLALVTYAEATAQRSRLGAMRLFTHERMATNIAWYEKLGFVITGMDQSVWSPRAPDQVRPQRRLAALGPARELSDGP